MVFQIVDDMLDITATDEQLGKPAGHDMVEGVYTLPVLRTLQAGGVAAVELLALLGKPLDAAEREKALAIVRSNGGVPRRCRWRANGWQRAEAACELLPPSVATDRSCSPPRRPCSPLSEVVPAAVEFRTSSSKGCGWPRVIRERVPSSMARVARRWQRRRRQLPSLCERSSLPSRRLSSSCLSHVIIGAGPGSVPASAPTKQRSAGLCLKDAELDQQAWSPRAGHGPDRHASRRPPSSHPSAERCATRRAAVTRITRDQ